MVDMFGLTGMFMRVVKVVSIALLGVLVLFLLGSGFLWANEKEPYPAKYWKKLSGKKVQCLLCPRRCIVIAGQRGLCGVRINLGGEFFTLGYGNPVAVNIDPIEKKPFFHVWPGAKALSIAVAGCNMRCLFCQNWQISQSRPDELMSYSLSPKEIVELAKQYGIKWIVYTYTEPTVFYEYMYDIALLAKKAGLFNGMHTCGYINPKPLKALLPYLDAVNVDLKGFSEKFYNQMGLMASLKPVLDTIKIIKDSGVWLEITNLVIPGFNDSPEMVEKMCKWILENLGPDVPLHFSRFYPNHKLTNVAPTPIKTLKQCVAIARKVGLHFVYIGNVPGDKDENTYCPKCGKLLIRRIGYKVLFNRIKDGRCPFCGQRIPGLWRKQGKNLYNNDKI